MRFDFSPFQCLEIFSLFDCFQVVIKDPPEFVKRPELEYIKDVGGKVSMPCRAVGTPKPTITWRRVKGHQSSLMWLIPI